MPVMNTCSQVIDFAQALEASSASYYERAAKHAPGQIGNLLASFVKENARLASDVKRAYISSISDAIEGCYAFQLEDNKYSIAGLIDQTLERSDPVAIALQLEGKIRLFYNDATQQSKGLLPDVSRALRMALQKRIRREQALRTLTTS